MADESETLRPLPTDTALTRLVRSVQRQSATNAFDAAIETCEALSGHSAECCAVAIRELRDKLIREYQ